jgi:hypothetical protein
VGKLAVFAFHERAEKSLIAEWVPGIERPESAERTAVFLTFRPCLGAKPVAS